MAAIARLAAATLWSRRRAAGSRSRGRPGGFRRRSCQHPIGVGELDGVRPFVLEGGLPLGISEGLAGFFAFAPPGVLTCPERPQRAFDRLAKPNLADLVAGAIEALVADRAERTLRLVARLARNVGCRRPDGGQFGAG